MNLLAPMPEVVQRILDIERSRPYACCNDTSKLVTWQAREDLFVEVCSTCKRNHIVAFADPGEYAATGKRMG